jgi:hypothetical protein
VRRKHLREKFPQKSLALFAASCGWNAMSTGVLGHQGILDGSQPVE